MLLPASSARPGTETASAAAAAAATGGTASRQAFSRCERTPVQASASTAISTVTGGIRSLRI